MFMLYRNSYDGSKYPLGIFETQQGAAAAALAGDLVKLVAGRQALASAKAFLRSQLLSQRDRNYAWVHGLNLEEDNRLRGMLSYLVALPEPPGYAERQKEAHEQRLRAAGI